MLITSHNKPIFVGGLQRSGTSLMRGIIGSHPEVAVMSFDLPLWTYFYPRYSQRDLNNKETYTELVENILSHPKMQDVEAGLSPSEIVQSWEGQTHTVDCGMVFGQILSHYAVARNKPRWGLKTPFNEFFVEDIFSAYHDAKFIHMIRDLRDVAVSMKSASFPMEVVWLRQQWLYSCKLATRYEEKYRDNYIAVCYENFVNDPETGLKEICTVLELPYSDSMLAMQGHPGWRGSNSLFSDIGMTQPWGDKRSADAAVPIAPQHSIISKSAIGRYIDHLPPAEIRFYQQVFRHTQYGELCDYKFHSVDLSIQEHLTLFYWRSVAGLRGCVMTTLKVLGINLPLHTGWSWKLVTISLLKKMGLYNFVRRTWRWLKRIKSSAAS